MLVKGEHTADMCGVPYERHGRDEGEREHSNSNPNSNSNSNSSSETHGGTRGARQVPLFALWQKSHERTG